MFFTKKNNTATIKASEIDNLLGKINLIDIREPYEYMEGHINTAKNIPMDVLLYNPNKYLDMNKEYYIVCRSGSRSSQTCQILWNQGFKVIDVLGGTLGYKGKLK